MLVARLSVRHKGCVTERLTGPLRAVQIGERDGSHLLMLGAPNARDMDQLLETFGVGRTRVPQLLYRSPQQALVLGQTTEKCVTRALVAHGCSILWPAWYQEGREAFMVLAPDRAQLAAAIEAVSPPNDVRIESLNLARGRDVPVSFTVGDVLGSLTRRQLDILRAAIAEGYYTTPRRATNGQLAARFGISNSTLKEHLRKAEQHLMHAFGEILLSQSWLLDSPRAGPGRRSG